MATSEDSTRQPHEPPCSVALHLSSPTCSISGIPPFNIITTYTCTTPHPIFLLISLFTDFAHHIIIRDPHHPRGKDRDGNDRPIGCFPTMQDEWDKEEVEFEGSKLVRLEPEDTVETAYTLFVETGPDVVRRSDVQFMRAGKGYWVELGVRKCWWMYAEEMDAGEMDERGMRDVLGKGESVEWMPGCKADFTAVA
ncbi:Nn.00g012930.m01.CDS01 [Neocucurbitaria sp. VM-36]